MLGFLFNTGRKTRHDILKEWNALSLEILIPSSLSKDTLELLQLGATEHWSPRFRSLLPLTVATVRPDVQAEIFTWAQNLETTQRKRIHDRGSAASGTGLSAFCRKFDADIERINQILFGTSVDVTDGEAGLFDSARVAILHSDGIGTKMGRADAPAGPQYVTRIGGLPTEAISQALLSTADQATLFSIETASCEKLRQQGILRPLALGEVALLVTSYCHGGKRVEGTLHCSSPVPQGGAYSVFARSLGRPFQKQWKP